MAGGIRCDRFGLVSYGADRFGSALPFRGMVGQAECADISGADSGGERRVNRVDSAACRSLR